MIGKLILLLVALGVFLGSAPIIHAEDVPKVRVIDAKISRHAPDSEIDQKVRLARRLMRDNNHQAASALLETLYEQDAENPVVVNLLLTCYNRLGYFTKADALCRRLIESDPENYVYRLRLAEILARQAKLDDAKLVYGEVLSLVQQNNIPQYRTILQSMTNHGLESMALALIDTVREKLADPVLFAFDRGEILKRQNNYRQAALEFFTVLEDSGRVAVDAENKLLALLDYQESSAEVEVALLEQVEKYVNVRAAKILSSFYLKAERFDRAFEFAVMQDSLEGQKGGALLNYMRSCWERKLYRQTARMAEYILKSYQNHATIGETWFLYAAALAQLGRFDDAITAYDTILCSFPRMQDKAEALYNIGDIYLNYLNDYSRALNIFDSVIIHYKAGHGYLNAILARPYCYLRQGILNEAKTSFEALLSRRLNVDMKEAVEYNLALILFFEKQFDSSVFAFRKLLVDYPRGYYINDAMQMLLLLEEAKEATGLLYDFSNALLFEQRRMLDSTASKLLLIADNPNRALADVALYKLVGLSLARADSSAAIGFIHKLVGDFPESYYVPYGMKIKADIYLTRSDRVDLARSIYRQLLEDYPNYPFISEVRKKMRQLEGEV